MPKNFLLRSSVVALAATCASSTFAQEAERAFTLSFDASIAATSPLYEGNDGILADDQTFDADGRAVSGSISLGRVMNDDWDWELSVARNSYDGDEGAVAGHGSLNETAEVGFETSSIDLTYGRLSKLGGATSRVGMGIAYLQAEANQGFAFTSGADGTLDRTLTSTFNGVGPRFEFDFQSAAITENDRMSVIGGFGLSLLAGEYTHTSDETASGLTTLSQGIAATTNGTRRMSETENGMMVEAGIHIGLQYEISEVTTLRTGLRQSVSSIELAEHSGFVETDLTATSFYFGMDFNF